MLLLGKLFCEGISNFILSIHSVNINYTFFDKLSEMMIFDNNLLVQDLYLAIPATPSATVLSPNTVHVVFVLLLVNLEV